MAASLPLVKIELPDPVYDSLVPVLGAMTHIEAGNIHALLCKSLQNLGTAASRSNCADDFSTPGTPKAYTAKSMSPCHVSLDQGQCVSSG